MDVDHRLLDARRPEPVERMVDQRPAGHLDQRLGPGRGQRPHPLAEPRRHHHRRRRHRRARIGAERERLSGSGSCRAVLAPRRRRASPAGTLASNQALTGASAGWARSRSSRPHMRGWKRGIMRLAVALPQPGEDAEDAGVALRRQRPISAFEVRALRRSRPCSGRSSPARRPASTSRRASSSTEARS